MFFLANDLQYFLKKKNKKKVSILMWEQFYQEESSFGKWNKLPQVMQEDTCRSSNNIHTAQLPV